MAERSGIFDMIGPVMIGPSSSHTAGVVRIGLAARKILGRQPERVLITFYNSFATTFQGHGSDKAVIAGLLDFKTDDVRIKTSLSIAAEAGLEFSFKPVGNASTMHPNTVKINAWAGNTTVEVVGESLGGGVINIAEINGYTANVSGGLPLLIILAEDRKGAIAFISDIVAHDDCNIATMTVSRMGKNGIACSFVEVDSPLRALTLDYMRSISWIKQVEYISGIK